MAAANLRDLPHLARRFFGVLRAAPLRPGEQARIAGWLHPSEAKLFWDQAPADQRHAFDVAMTVATARPGDAELVKAALLHDVGKRHVRLGAFGRSLATLMEMARLPLPARYRRYREHGALGAEDLVGIGLSGIIVEFARRHPGPAPHGVEPSRWQALLAADNA